MYLKKEFGKKFTKEAKQLWQTIWGKTKNFPKKTNHSVKILPKKQIIWEKFYEDNKLFDINLLKKQKLLMKEIIS